MKNSDWQRLLTVVDGCERVVVVGGGPSREIILRDEPELFDHAAVCTVNGSIMDFPDARMQFVGDPRALDEWYFPNIRKFKRLIVRGRQLWLVRTWCFEDHPDLPMIDMEQLDCSIDIRNTRGNVYFGGTGAQAVRIMFDICSALKIDLITVGMDFGLYYPPRSPIRYASKHGFAQAKLPEKEKAKWDSQVEPGYFRVFGYNNQIRVLEQIAAHYARGRYPFALRTRSAVNWIHPEGARIDDDIVRATLQFLGEGGVDEID